ncbi:MAG: BatA domain-containing protein [Mariniblastus sp.]|nr:BatA domain-containing protein [Mariniblastus sp.]
MFSWLMNPWMLGLGGLAVLSPIVIHLLNKRRFKIVNWAAMDFLFEAEKKNRRRVQVENLLLLLLRCLAMLLIGLLLARPFLPSSVASLLQQDVQYERVILWDDSLSSRVLNGNEPSIDVARESIKRLVSGLAESDETDDWLTILLTSDPGQPLLANEPVTKNTLPMLIETIDQVQSTDTAADYPASMGEFRRYLGGQTENVGRVAYVFSDMRAVDWLDSVEITSDSAPNKLLNQAAEDAVDAFLIDTAGANDENLAIVGLRALDLQAADKVVRFAVELANFGNTTANDVRVVLQVDDAPPLYQVAPSLAPGQTGELIFPYLFSGTGDTGLTNSEEEAAPLKFENYRVTASIDRQSFSREELSADQLIEDSQAVFAARVLNGIPILLVDGDPSAVSERSETHYLQSLDVLGTGLNMNVVTASKLESVSLSEYEVIFLCNVDEASPDRIAALKQWTEDGGALVFMPGNKVRATVFNDSFYQDGAGLSAVGLEAIAGDPTMSSWVNFEVDPQVHPSLRVILESDDTSLNKVDVFSWWTSVIDDEQIGKTVQVPLRLSDPRNSVAMAERRMGNGTVIVYTIPGDGDWTMWPSSPTFAPVMIDLIDYLVGSVGEKTNVRIGGQVSYPVDLSIYDSRVSLRDPEGDKVESVARPTDESEIGKENVLYQVKFDEILQRGFYEIGLKRNAGQTDKVLFASNIDPREGQLKRVPESAMEGDFFSGNVRRVSAADLETEEVSGGNTEIWPQLLVFLIVVLALEQFLGWWFGRKR